MAGRMIAGSGRRAVLVVGYYRSGTSALSGALVDVGIRMPHDTEANEHNPKGYFEDTALIQFDMDVLNVLGSIWSDVRFLPAGWIERPDMSLYRERLADLLQKKLADAPLFALKHPHLCRLFPIYRQVLDELGVEVAAIHTHRSPFVIAASQKKKNNLPRAHALLLWASYMVDAESHTRLVPRSWITYEDLLADQAGTVQHALQAIGIASRPVSHGVITETLRRSNPLPEKGLFGPLASLVQDVEAAILARSASEVWDGLRARVTEMVRFLEEIGATSNPIIPGIGGIQAAHPLAAGPTLGAGGSEGHALRPAERTDAAARRRLSAHCDARALPRLTVIVAVPSGMAGRRDHSLASLQGGWRQPDKVLVIQVGQEAERPNAATIMVEDDKALAGELWRRVNAEADTEFVAILNAGDRIEPDAIARLMLAAATAPQAPAMLYCDEIVASAEHPWIRTKPAWDTHRLRESCFVGDWAWYATAALRDLGGFDGKYAGSEEQDLQLRIAERGLLVVRVPEALFVRHPGTRRDSISLDQAIAHAVAAIEAHLGRSGIPGRSRRGRFPGMFEVEYPAAERPMVIGIRCDRAGTARVNLAAGRVIAAMKSGDRVVYLAPRDAQDKALDTYLERVAREVSPLHPGVLVRPLPATLGGCLASLRALLAEDGYVALIDPAAEPDRDDQFDVLCGLLEASPGAGIAGVRAYWRDGDTTRLIGPVLPGAAARMGAHRDAENPGPGGWLAATQTVGAIDGPCIVVRAAALADAPALSGMETWAGICRQVRERGYATLWCPRLKSEVARPAEKDPEQEAASRQPYDPALHHPALSLIGDSLLLESRFGLIQETPAGGDNLVSGDPGCHLVSLVRAVRQFGHMGAVWAAEPIDPFSARRAMAGGRRWVRLNPDHVFEDVGGYTGAWTRMPSPEQHHVVKAARQCIATSEPILRALRGMGARRPALWQPVLDRSVWEALPPTREGRPVALWIDERVAVPWLHEMIAATREAVAWIVVSDAEFALPGDVAKLKRPVFEDGWHSLFAHHRPRFLVRPTPKTNWLDDHTLLMGAAADCVLLAGAEGVSERVRSRLDARWLPSDHAAPWIKAISRREAATPSTRAHLLDDRAVFWLREGTSIDWLNADPAAPEPAPANRRVA